jgi:hypothetical protein
MRPPSYLVRRGLAFDEILEDSEGRDRVGAEEPFTLLVVAAATSQGNIACNISCNIACNI